MKYQVFNQALVFASLELVGSLLFFPGEDLHAGERFQVINVVDLAGSTDGQ